MILVKDGVFKSIDSLKVAERLKRRGWMLEGEEPSEGDALPDEVEDKPKRGRKAK